MRQDNYSLYNMMHELHRILMAHTLHRFEEDTHSLIAKNNLKEAKPKTSRCPIINGLEYCSDESWSKLVREQNQQRALEQDKEEMEQVREYLEKDGWKYLEFYSDEQMRDIVKQRKASDDNVKRLLEEYNVSRISDLPEQAFEEYNVSRISDLPEQAFEKEKQKTETEEKHTETFVLKKKEVDFFSKIVIQIQDFFSSLGW